MDVFCFRNKPVISKQLLVNFPAKRVNPNSHFANYGIDFYSFFFINYNGYCKGTSQKFYVTMLFYRNN